MFQIATPVQILSAALYAVTALLLLYATSRASPRGSRMAAWLAIGTALGAINFMMMAYAGEKPLDLERSAAPKSRFTIEGGSIAYAAPELQEHIAAAASGLQTRIASLMGTERPVDDVPVRVRDCDHCPELVIVKPGYFRMGAASGDVDASPAERPGRVVRIGRIYAIGRFEVTVGEFQAYLTATARDWPACPIARDVREPRLPVTCVSWNDARGYVRWLSETTRLRFRLPSEAEWEYGARAGSSDRYATGEMLPPGAANIASRRGPQPVGQYAANGFGLYDVHGNAAELAADCWRSSPFALPGDGLPAEAALDCPARALRDATAASPVETARVSVRHPIASDARLPGVGFRVMREL